MEIDFNPDKDRINRRRHGISLERLRDMVIATVDTRKEYGEDRWILIGLIDGRPYVAVVTYRVSIVWVISLRPATRREQQEYFAYGF